MGGQIDRTVLFLTGTRADWGKIKPLITATEEIAEVRIFATGMHMLKEYGMTLFEITRAGMTAYPFINQDDDTPQDRVLANTVNGLSLYVRENPPDLIVIHGDRVESLAGAIVGNLNGILTAHIEGGELSGTVDGMIRHSITKLAHVHFCANTEAEARLIRLGEHPDTIYPIGSPDIDVMLGDLPPLYEAMEHYKIPFNDYGILIYHPVVGEPPDTFLSTFQAAENSGMNWIAIYPNNDPGSNAIREYMGQSGLYCLPSMRFEYFLTILKHAQMILGNSSAGVREAPVYGVPTINVGTRQDKRATLPSVISVPDNRKAIAEAISNPPPRIPTSVFGKGDSAKRFISILSEKGFWDTPRQKQFYEGEK